MKKSGFIITGGNLCYNENSNVVLEMHKFTDGYRVILHPKYAEAFVNVNKYLNNEGVTHRITYDPQGAFKVSFTLISNCNIEDATSIFKSFEGRINEEYIESRFSYTE